jgi:hypothetical protein
MYLQIWAAVLPTILAFASARRNNVGVGSYTHATTVTAGGPGPSVTVDGPPVPTVTTVAVTPNTGSYQLNSSFEITDTAVTRTFDWTIA